MLKAQSYLDATPEVHRFLSLASKDRAAGERERRVTGESNPATPLRSQQSSGECTHQDCSFTWHS